MHRVGQRNAGRSGARIGLGELPESLLRERWPGAVLDPTAGLYLEWQNKYKTLQFGRTIGTAEANLMQGDYLRTYLYIGNKDAANDVFLGIGTSSTGINGALIIPRGFAEFIGGEMGGAYCPRESINISASAANTNIVVITATLDPYEMRQE